MTLSELLLSAISFLIYVIPFLIINYFLWKTLKVNSRQTHFKLFTLSATVILGAVFWSCLAFLENNNSWNIPLEFIGIVYVVSIYLPFLIILLLLGAVISYLILDKNENLSFKIYN